MIFESNNKNGPPLLKYYCINTHFLESFNSFECLLTFTEQNFRYCTRRPPSNAAGTIENRNNDQSRPSRH
jgi:hypothetical protein